jgi:hypothetical protein
MTEQRLIEQDVFRIPGRILLGLLPGVDQHDLADVRRTFAAHIASQRPTTGTWTRATPHRPGQITYTPARCPECHGRGFSHRRPDINLARTGNPMVCGECRGNRSARPTRQVARYANPATEEARA